MEITIQAIQTIHAIHSMQSIQTGLLAIHSIQNDTNYTPMKIDVIEMLTIGYNNLAEKLYRSLH
jgi:hypothetical protein